MFSRVLVANRGEIAVRVIRALHELGIEAVAVYSTADAGTLPTRLADRSICIGPPSATESYLNIASVVAAGETTGCEAVHPGYGFLSENPDFVRACEDNDLVFIGPDADVMARMGDKVEAKRELAAAGLPLVPGTESVEADEAAKAAAELGYPVLLKASAGGGGKGMRLVERADDLEDAFDSASGEALAAFGDGTLYLEKLIIPARHVEVQVLCDADGGVLTLGERECSIQRRHQKLIEESPSPALDDATREAMETGVARACRAISYLNAGTFEFLLAPDGSYYFIELNARLQVEHPVSELVTGMDIVREQLRIAAGEQLHETGRAARRGHAIEIRLNAEDPARGFAPAPGVIDREDMMAKPEVQETVAERLKALGVRGVLVQMAENGQLLALKCEMPMCYRPEGRKVFDPWPDPKSAPGHDWSPNPDHYPTLRRDGGQLKPWNVRLAHVYCNNVDHGWRTRIRSLLEKNPKPTAEQAKAALAGNICRCGTYSRVLEAVLDTKGVSRG
jgi:acetyl-CoA carboxylase biotin carboxylase subunit